MKIYNYHPHTGEYLGPSTADPDPLVPNNWLIPAAATTVIPPELGNQEVAVFDGTNWSVVPDRRGRKFWLPNGDEVTISDLHQEIPADASFDPPTPPVADKTKQVETVVTNHIFEIAAKDGWDSATSCIARASYDGPWRQHGIAFGQWADACWIVAFKIQQELTNGTRQEISDTEVVALLPEMIWPA